MIKNLAIGGLLLWLGSCATPGHSHMDGGEEHTHSHDNVVVRAGAGDTVDNPFHPVKLILSHADSASDITVYEFTLPPRSPGSPPHTHTLEDEYFYVVEGELSALSGEDVLTLAPGDFAALNRGTAHMFWNGSEQTTRLIMMTTGASFEAFLEGAGPRLAEAQPASPEAAGAVLGQLAAEHGITISMEKMPPEAAPIYMPAPTSEG